MAYELPSDIVARIQLQLETGEFESVDAVLREALDVLERRQESLRRLQAMVLEADEDVDAGRVGVFETSSIIEELNSRLAHYQANPDLVISWDESKRRIRSRYGR
jgi:Arc/MetJ-type ribon-helix-helix transcriptional regulator